MLIGWTINYYYLEIHWYTTFFTIVDVSASTEAFVGTVCLIAVRIKKAIHTRKEQDNSMNRDEGSYQLSPIYDNLFAPKLSGERQLDRPFRWRLQSSRPKRQQ